MRLRGQDEVRGSVQRLVGTVPMQLQKQFDSALSFLSHTSLYPFSSQIHSQIEDGSFGGSPMGLSRSEDQFPMELHLCRHLAGLPILS